MYFLDPMCSSDKITRFVTEPLLSLGRKATVKNCLEKIIYGADCVATSDADTLVEEFLDGKTVLFIGGDEVADGGLHPSSPRAIWSMMAHSMRFLNSSQPCLYTPPMLPVAW